MARPISLFLLFACAAAAQWTQFRGPNGSGVADSAKLPVSFGPKQGVVWKTDLPPGHSSPVITGDRIFLTGRRGWLPRAGRPEVKVVDQGGTPFHHLPQPAHRRHLCEKGKSPRPRIEELSTHELARIAEPRHRRQTRLRLLRRLRVDLLYSQREGTWRRSARAVQQHQWPRVVPAVLVGDLLDAPLRSGHEFIPGRSR